MDEGETVLNGSNGSSASSFPSRGNASESDGSSRIFSSYFSACRLTVIAFNRESSSDEVAMT
jgi:hypothetical protein